MADTMAVTPKQVTLYIKDRAGNQIATIKYTADALHPDPILLRDKTGQRGSKIVDTLSQDQTMTFPTYSAMTVV